MSVLIFIFACMFCGLMGLVMGFALGVLCMKEKLKSAKEIMKDLICLLDECGDFCFEEDRKKIDRAVAFL